MNKFSMFSTRIVMAAAIALAFTSCRDVDFGGIDGNGNVTTETRTVNGDFTDIEASNGLNVVLEQSDTKSITVETDENLQEHIITKVENGVLIIETDENIDESEAKKVTVKLPKITGIKASSGTSITSTNVLKGDAIKIKSSSGSSITLSGKALSLETASSSGSEIDASKLLVNDVTAKASSGSSISVHPIVSLKAKASSGSSVDYHNVPKSITKEETSGGSVSQE